MKPGELARQLGGAVLPVPVRVRGYRRSFCQEPSWRTGAAERRGVLTVRPSGEGWINAVLVCGCDPAGFRTLDHRERGYRRARVVRSAIEPYASAPELDDMDRISIYRGRSEKWNPELLPNPDYLDLCIGAAEQWGEAFLEDFLATTRVGDVPLRTLRRGRSAVGG